MNYNYNSFTKDAIKKALNLDKYKYIMDNLYKVKLDDKKDKEAEKFRKTFNGFYRIRMNSTWRDNFYKVFEQNKYNKNIKFLDILEAISIDNSIAASFASKMLATLRKDMPILDSNVLTEFKLKKEYDKSRDNKDKENIDRIYNLIHKKEKELLKNDEKIKKMVEKFKTEYSEYDIEDIKVLDYIIWLKQGANDD